MALTVELRTSNSVQLHRRIPVDGIFRPQDASFQRAPGYHASQCQQRIERADRVVCTQYKAIAGRRERSRTSTLNSMHNIPP